MQGCIKKPARRPEIVPGSAFQFVPCPADGQFLDLFARGVLLEQHKDRLVGIPTLGAVRSLNLANAVGIALYEALRQVGALADVYVD